MLGDIISTEYGLGKGAIEINPLVKNKWMRWGHHIFKLSLPFILQHLRLQYPNSVDGVNISFLILIGVMSIIGINNTYQLSKYFRDKIIDFSEIERKIKEKFNL